LFAGWETSQHKSLKNDFKHPITAKHFTKKSTPSNKTKCYGSQIAVSEQIDAARVHTPKYN
jgi:hypothetical protein